MNKITLRFSEAAAADIIKQADWYKLQSGLDVAERWEKAISSAVLRIVNSPAAGALCRFPHPELRDIRRVPIRGFPKHLIFYRVLGRDVLVLRVLHGARDLEKLL